MKKYIFVFISFFLFLFYSCTDSRSLFNSGNFRKTVSYVNSLNNPTLLDIYYQMLSYIELKQPDSALNSAKVFLLMYPEDDDTYKNNRTEIVDYIIKNELSDETYIMLLNTSDGLDAQLVLYRSYVNKKNFQNAKSIYDNYLLKELNDSDIVLLLSNYSFSDSEIIQALLRFASTMDKENIGLFLDYSENLLNNSSNYNFTVNDYQQFISSLNIISELSYIEREQKSVCYKLMGRIYLALGRTEKSNECFNLSYSYNMYDEELKLYMENSWNN